MTPPNVTQGDWTVAAESGCWWVTDSNYNELPDTHENAVMMAASKRMAEVLNRILGDRDKRLDGLLWKEARQVLLAVGYTDETNGRVG